MTITKLELVDEGRAPGGFRAKKDKLDRNVGRSVGSEIGLTGRVVAVVELVDLRGY